MIDRESVSFSLLSKPSTCPALGVTCVDEIRSENEIGTGSSLKEFCGKSAELETFFFADNPLSAQFPDELQPRPLRRIGKKDGFLP
jgi:hypothetical protein